MISFGTAKFKVVPCRELTYRLPMIFEDAFPFTRWDMSVSKRVSFSVMSSQDQSTPPVCLMEGGSHSSDVSVHNLNRQVFS